MSFDNLTISALTIVIVMVIVVIFLVRYTRDTDTKMRNMAHHIALLHTHEKAQDLCKKIKAIFPDHCAGLDFTLKENGDDFEIDEWKSKHPRPKIK